MNKTKGRIIILIIGGISMLVFYIHRQEYKYYNTYCKNYYVVVAKTMVLSFDNINSVNGTFENTWEEDFNEGMKRIYVQYEDGRLFAYTQSNNGNITLRRVELTSENYRFGRKQIGIGTDKEIINKIYSKSYRCIQEENGNYCVEDGNYQIIFSFIDNKVSKILISKSDVRHGYRGWKKVD